MKTKTNANDNTFFLAIKTETRPRYRAHRSLATISGL